MTQEDFMTKEKFIEIITHLFAFHFPGKIAYLNLHSIC
jgi:hypothetical protein